MEERQWDLLSEEEREETPKERPVRGKFRGKFVTAIHGHKGTGKTVTALGFPGSIYAQSMDGKTRSIADYMFPDQKFDVLDLSGLFRWEEEQLIPSARRVYDRAMEDLTRLRNQGGADWILLDCFDIQQYVGEMLMREKFKLGPFENFANKNYWKERRRVLKYWHTLMKSIARRGVIYTMFSEKDEIIEQGDFIRKKDVPAYIDIIMWDTDVVLRTDILRQEKGQRFMVEVVSSKVPVFKSGDVFDATDRTITEMVDFTLQEV